MKGRSIRDLRRPRAFREPRRLFTIVCEGKNTEPAYFQALQATIRDAHIDLEIIPAAGVPMTIAERSVELAASRRKRGRTNSFEENDEVWAVFDRDQHPNYHEAVGLCESKGVRVARSNPCFELWLILHDTDFDRSADSQTVQRHLPSIRPDYDPKGSKRLDCKRFMQNVEAAEHRAKRQLAARETEGAAYGPPSTTVFRLTCAIRKAAALSRGTPP